MRVLYVSHDFLPKHASGTEIHTAELAAAMRARGVETELFTTEKDIARPHLSLHEREWEGLRVHELVNNLFYDDFRETWDWPAAEAAFARVLDAYRPDVVHLMHLMYLSVGCAEEAHRRGIPVFFSLHDYWLTCARFGQLVHADGSLCHSIDFARCGTCLSRLKYAQSPLERGAARVVAGVKRLSGVSLEGAVRRASALTSQRKAEEPAAEVAVDEVRASAMASAARGRSDELRRRLLSCVRRFLAPSRFLRQRFLDWGIPPGQIDYAPTGIDLAPFAGLEPEPPGEGEPLRVAFLGTFAPHKGAHVLLEAWAALPEGTRAKARLSLHGSTLHNPDYVARLEGSARAVGAEMPGELTRRELARTWPGIDLLVMPSTWFENAPLALLEARATRTPALVSDLGGMAELVEEGRHGWRFPAGDARALAAALARCIDDPARLTELDFGSRETIDLASRADDMLARYGRAVAEDGA